MNLEMCPSSLEEEIQNQNFGLIMDIKALKIMQKMGYKHGSGLGKHEQGIKSPIDLSFQLGRTGLGSMQGTWDFTTDDVFVEETVVWLERHYYAEDNDEPNKEMLSWLKEGPPQLEIENETNFCDRKLVREVLQAKEIFNELGQSELSQARSRANPFETIRSMFFLNRAAMKIANIDSVMGYMFSNIDENVHHKERGGPFYFADVCAGPGGFTEYMLWRKQWRFKGFGFTLRNENDFRLGCSSCASGASFETIYGPDGDGNVCSPGNIVDFREKVLHDTGKEGVHFMMSDGGFSVQGKENLQEVLSKDIYACQCLVALEVVREHGHFVTKLFDVFTLFSVGLLYLLSRCFEKVCILKPNTSRPANSERYLVCSNLNKTGHFNRIKEYLWTIVKRLWELKDDGNLDILEIVPLSVIKQDEKFLSYVLNSNNKLASKQITALKKLATFCRNPELREFRQQQLRKTCLELWRIPDKPKKHHPPQTVTEEYVRSIIDKPEILLVQPREVTDVISFNNILDDVTEWSCCFANNLTCSFYLGVGSSKTYRLQGNKWIKMKSLQLYRGTLLYGEYVKEACQYGTDETCRHSLHVVDALKLGDDSLACVKFSERMELIRLYCKSVNKEFHPYSIRVRPKVFSSLSSLDISIIRNNLGVYESVLPPLGFKAFKESFAVNSLLLLKTNERQTFYSTYVLRVRVRLDRMDLEDVANEVQTAVKFLQNPSVTLTPLAQKQKFLQRKGLSDQEIQLACERSGAYTVHEKQAALQGPPSNSRLLLPNAQLSVFDRIREIVHNIAIFSIVAYIIHRIYQRYIAPFLFGKKKKSIEESVDELDKSVKTSVDQIRDELQSVKVEVSKLGQDTDDTRSRHYQELKSEISSVKGLLLNRKQFPSANTPVVPPSIPAWQMSSVPLDHPDGEQEEPKEDLLEELGSGSGSSEQEHGMKTSESSLEIIYSSRDCDAESVHSRKSNRED